MKNRISQGMLPGFRARSRRHVSFANVASALALFVALGGGSAAALAGGDDQAPQAKAQLREGTVVKGVIGATDNTGPNPGGVRAFESLPRGARLPAGPTDATVTVNDGADDAEHNCAGTASEPKAPRGVVCIYTPETSNASDIEGQTVEGARFGFRVAWTPAENSLSRVTGTWAYKVP